jgi:LmbE family N-acetylglucosaminyl deacetylase
MVTPLAEGQVLRLAQDAPSAALTDLTGPGAVLVLSPHPDDETLGCGAAIAAACAAGVRVIVAVLTDGAGSHPRSRAYPRIRLAALRREEVAEAVSQLTQGHGRVVHLNHPDQGPLSVGQRRAYADKLVRLVDDEAVSALWTTWEGDPHVDHRRAARLAIDVVTERPRLRLWRFPGWGRFTQRGLRRGEAIRRFEVGEFGRCKRAALAAHRSQMTRLIHDDPDGFVMDASTQQHFLESPEIFIRGGGHV